MSDKVKLIIEIPTGGAFERDIYTPICAEGFIRDEYNEKVAEAIKNGIPLDSVKTEIKEKRDNINHITSHSPYSTHRFVQELLCEILASIDNAESEDKE